MGFYSQHFFYPLDKPMSRVVKQSTERDTDYNMNDIVDYLRRAIYGYIKINKKPKTS